MVAAFFGADKDKTREELRGQYLSKVEAWRANAANRRELEETLQQLRNGEKPVPPLHWEIEFPEVFGRENPGFDAMVGNPPFLGGKNIAPVLGDTYLSSIRALVNSNKGSLDLAAFFLHQMARLVRDGGAFGLVATEALTKVWNKEGRAGLSGRWRALHSQCHFSSDVARGRRSTLCNSSPSKWRVRDRTTTGRPDGPAHQ